MATFRRILPVALTLFVAGCDPQPAANTEVDRARLLELHAEVMEAHRKSNVDLILQAETDTYVVANRGVITRPTVEERRGRLGPYLSNTRFSEYRDAVPPIVTVSRDGSLGWVIVQVYASGEQTVEGGSTEQITFESAWIELYEKQGNQWIRVGNVSNFKPG